MLGASDQQQIREHLAYSVTGNFEIRCRNRKGEWQSRIFNRDDIEHASSTLKFSDDSDCYVIVNPTSLAARKFYAPGPMTSDKHIKSITTVAVDVDAPRDDTSKPATEAERAKAGETVNEIRKLFPFEPMVISTGNGYSMWFRTTPIEAVELRGLIRALAKKFPNVDVACQNPSRCMRLAGTINQKSGRTAQIVSRPDNSLILNPYGVRQVTNELGGSASAESEGREYERMGLNSDQVAKWIAEIDRVDPCWLDERSNWIKAAGALKHEGELEDWFLIEWLNWSANPLHAHKFDGDESATRQWESLDRDRGCIATIKSISMELEPLGADFSFLPDSAENEFADYKSPDPEPVIAQIDEKPKESSLVIPIETALDRWDLDTKPKLWRSTSFPDFMIGPDRLSVVGGVPGVGKTTFVLQAMVEMLLAYPDLRVLIVEAEMSPSSLLDRIAPMFAPQPLHASRLALREYVDDEREIAYETKRMLAEKLRGRFAILEAPYNQSRIEKARKEFRPDIIVVDYLQRIQPKQKSDSANERLSFLMGALRGLATHGNVGVMLVAAVNRASTEVVNLASFRDSSEIEYGVDYAWGLERKKDETIQIRQLKNRYGQCSTISLTQDPASMRFADSGTDPILAGERIAELESVGF